VLAAGRRLQAGLQPEEPACPPAAPPLPGPRP